MFSTDSLSLPNEDGYLAEFDPSYQSNLFMVEGAMRELGMEGSTKSYPDYFDTHLRNLIDKVPLE